LYQVRCGDKRLSTACLSLPRYNRQVAIPTPNGAFIVDTHLDLAWHCQEHGRDIVDASNCPDPVMVTLPWLQQAGVRLICATLFTMRGRPEGERRYKLHSQYEMYQQWFSRYPAELIPVHNQRDLARLAAYDMVEVEGRRAYPIGVILLMEGLDLLKSPAELQTWFERGVRVASLTWYGANIFASGDFGDNRGLKPLGHVMLSEYERLGMIFDVSHLNDAGFQDVVSAYQGPLCASHSNARSIANHQRNLTDQQAMAIAQRSGVIGINLLATLVQTGWRRGDPQPPLAAAGAHVAYLSQLLGAAHVGLGSDLDGGLTPTNTPKGIDRYDQVQLLAEDLRGRGWAENDVAGFLGGNWWRFFSMHLPP